MSEDQGSAARDEGLVAFVEAIEGVLRGWRGTEHVLSPRDFALARAWYEAGVPLAAVLVAADLAYAKDPATSSLAALRHRVEDLAALGPRPAAGAREVERLSLPELAERLAALKERLLELPGRLAARSLVDLAEIADLVSVASRPNWDYLRARLRRIDELVAELAVAALSTPEAEQLHQETRRATERHRDRVDPRSLEEAVSRLVRQRAREMLRLPRVGLG